MVAGPKATALARILLVTGPAGAGRSTAVGALEDLGYEVVDNLPLSLVPGLLDRPARAPTLVLGIDTRNREFSVKAFVDLIAGLRSGPVPVDVLYLDCTADVLLRRFSETRRRHPMAPSESPGQGIERELALLEPVRGQADIILDTSAYSPHDLRQALADRFGAGRPTLAVSLVSFGYKRGMPSGLDMVFDCRFLSNPHWVAGLRDLDGRDSPVVDHIAADDKYAPFVTKVNDLVQFLLPAFQAEGKAHLSIGFGCTGGQHRSVAMVERISEDLREAGWQVSVQHHELDRRGPSWPVQGRGTER